MRLTKKWAFIMVAVPIIGLCVQAGFWQLDRAEEKTALIARSTVGADLIDQSWQLGAHDPRQQAARISLPVQVASEQLVFLDNRVQDRQAGYEVFSEAITADGLHRLWVNWGWIPALPGREQLPAVDVPRQLQLVGRWVGAMDSHAMGDADPESFANGLRVQSLRGQVPGGSLPGVVLAQGVLARDAVGPMPRLGPETHYGYAVQWFLLAAVLSGLTGWMVRRGLVA